MWTNARQPNTFKWLYDAFFPNQTSSGISPSKGTDGERLMISTAVFIASPQKGLGRLACEIIHQTLSSMVLFILSARPFNYGVFGGVFSSLIPWSLQYDSNGPRYSPPLSARMHINFWPVSRSTLIWNSLNASNTSSFDLNKEIQTFLEWSSIKVTKYNAPPSDFADMEHTSVCTNSRMCFLLLG